MTITNDNVGAKLYLMNAVRDRLTVDCIGEDGNPIVKTFKLYDGQFENEAIEDVYDWPAVFFFFSNLAYKGQGQNLQTSDATFTLFIGVTTIDTEDMDFLNIVEMINLSLQGYEDPGFIPLGGIEADRKNNRLFTVLYRMAERQAITRDNVRIWQIDYYTFLRDVNTDRRQRLQIIPEPLTVEITEDPGEPFLRPD